MNLSLRQKINTAILVTFGSIAVIFTVVQLPFQAHRLEMEVDNVKLLLQTLVEREEDDLANEIFDQRIKAIEIRLKEIAGVEGVLSAVVFDTGGLMLASAGEVTGEMARHEDAPKGLAGNHAEVEQVTHGHETVLLFSKGLSFLGEQTGMIHIHYSLARLVENQRISFLIFAGLMAATLAVMLILLNLILSRAIISPVMFLKTAAQAIVQGDYETALAMHRTDELGSLADSFDKMRAAVKEKVGDLEQLKEKYRLLYQKAPVMLCTVDRDGRIIEANDILAQTLGVARGELMGARSFAFFLDADGTPGPMDILAFIEDDLSSSGEIRGRQFQMASKTGAVLEVIVSVFIQRDADGVIDQATVSMQDITEKLRAESALRKSEHRLRLITDNMVDIISQTDAGVNVIYVSPSVQRILGYLPQELLGESAVSFIHPEDVEPVMETAAAARKTGRSAVILQYRWRHAEGHYVWVESAARLLYNPDGTPKGAVFGTRDISESKKADQEKQRLELQLLQAQKLESIGRLAGGVAHDLNNLLTPVLGYSEMLMADRNTTPPVLRKAESINKAGIRAKNLVHQLLAFSRKQTLEFISLDINQVLREFEKLLNSALREDIRLEVLPARDLAPVMADVGQIEQVIMNLALNASEAMASGGRITIETAMADLDEAYASAHPGTAVGKYVVLSVSDTGHGMDKETRSKIFEPFFSTRGEQGTGLGLATVYGIVKQHNGNIWVYSEPGRGTTVKVYLPVTDQLPEGESQETPARARQGGSETILLVEDDESVLELAADILRQHGYRTYTAGNGRAALAMVRARKLSVDLLLTDVVMPDMNGRELYTALCQTLPELKVVYMSGYTNNIITHHGVLDQGLQFIHKPFTVDSLTEKIRNVLDRI